VTASGLGGVIRTRLERWGMYDLPLEREVFGSVDPDRIAEAVSQWCLTHLGARIAQYHFFESSSGSVHGVALTDGRDVVVKVHRPGVPRVFLDGLHAVQSEMVGHGCPGPRPLVAPTVARPGHVTAEAMLGPFAKADGHDPRVRGALAGGLVAFLAQARALFPDGAAGLVHPMNVADGELYPEPHSMRFDFTATSAGAEWIDELAREARTRLAKIDPGPAVLTHGDWRTDNVRVVDGHVVAIYDWDSVCMQPEAASVAIAAATFPVDWDSPPGRRFPSPEAIGAFITEYERARATPFSGDERHWIAASIVTVLAYGARCERADTIADHPRVGDSHQGLLHAIGTGLLDQGLDRLR
jgi:Ser/Thr protein kinase RdoA (MazF antagonist)